MRPPPLHPAEAQFLDANCSLERLSPNGGTPWLDNRLMTLVGASKPVMRRRRADGTVEVRLLYGIELMAFIGWHWDDYAEGECTMLDNATLTSLAGNAFSAFAVGPVLAATLPLLGLQVAEPEAALEVSDLDDSDSDGALQGLGAHRP